MEYVVEVLGDKWRFWPDIPFRNSPDMVPNDAIPNIEYQELYKTLSSDGTINFPSYLIAVNISQYSIDVKVIEVTGGQSSTLVDGKWIKSSSDYCFGDSIDGNKFVEDPTKVGTFLTAQLKWDSCCHYYVSNDGYMHLCGPSYIEGFCYLVKRCYQLASELIPRFD